MKYVLLFVIGMAGIAIWKHTGLSIFRWEYWALAVLFMVAGGL